MMMIEMMRIVTNDYDDDDNKNSDAYHDGADRSNHNNVLYISATKLMLTTISLPDTFLTIRS